MSISQEQLQKIALKLSKIPTNNPKLLTNISDILQYVELLSEVNTDGVKATISVGETQAFLREDTMLQSSVLPKTLLSCSQQRVIADQIVLPNIMK